MTLRLLFPLAFLGLLVSCGHSPGDTLLADLRKSEGSDAQPAITIHLHQSVDDDAGSTTSPTRALMVVLGNHLGFRIEAATVRKGLFFRTTRYTFTEFNAPNLPGVTFARKGDEVRIRPDFRQDLVIESAKSPDAGFADLGRVASADPNPETVAMVATWMGKDPGQAVQEANREAKDKAQSTKEAFVQNIERLRSDKGFRRAWVVSYRRKLATTIPAGHPFWSLMDCLGNVQPSNLVTFSPEFMGTTDFWARHGKEDVKDSLKTFIVVAFEDNNGHLGQTLGWRTLLEK